LDFALSLALGNHPDLRASRARVEAGGGRARQSGLWPNPELALSAEDWPADGGGFDAAKKLLGVEQTVPFPGKKRLDKAIGSAAVRAAEAELAMRRAELARDVTVAFCQALAAERLVAVAEELLQMAESSADTARKRVAAGAAADQEHLRAEIPRDQARGELLGFKGDLAAARQTLALLLGRPGLRDVPLSGALAETASPDLLGQATAQWLPTHPGVVAARNGCDRADLELRRARLEPYPDVKLGISGGQDSGRGGSIVQFGVALPLPIVDRSKGKIRQAMANVAIAQAESESLELRLTHAWQIAAARLRTAAEQAASYRVRILPQADEALRLVRAGFEQGKFGFIDLLDTQRTAAQARLSYLQRLLELNVAQAQLQSLLAWPMDTGAGSDRAGRHPTP
jgi:cobalt-zinc-cadmium efflux system outer membrane protein